MQPLANKPDSERASPAFPRFAPPGAFARDVRARVDAWFAASGRPRRGDPRLHRKAAVVLAWFAGSWGFTVLIADGWVQAVAGLASLVLASASIPMNLGHDGGHRAFSRRAWANAAALWAANVIGFCGPWWRVKHGTLHHGYTRVAGLDDDLQQGSLFRMHPDQPFRPLHRAQHLYAWVLYPFLQLSVVVAGLRFLATGRVGTHQFRRPGLRATLGAVSAYATGAALFLVVPALLHPLGTVLAGAAAWSGGLSLILVLVFQSEHCVGQLESPRQAVPGRFDTDWAEAEVRATQDYAPSNRLLTWYCGALNLHVPHHLFPGISHTHLAELASVVRAACVDHGLPYRTVPSWTRALGDHGRWLRELGRGGEAVVPSAPAPVAVDAKRELVATATSGPAAQAR